MSDFVAHCGHCDEPMHVDRNGWYVGPDNTSDCVDSDTGHQVNGKSRP